MVADRVYVTAAVILHEGKVLLARRSAGPLQGKWEFPGGKVEAGEPPEACVAREIAEELGITVAVKSFFARSEHDYPHIHIRLDGFFCEWSSGQLTCAEHQELAWVPPAALMTYDLAPADVRLAQKAMEALHVQVPDGRRRDS